MKITTDMLIQKITGLIDHGYHVLETAEDPSDTHNYPVDTVEFYKFRQSSLSFLQNLFGAQHTHCVTFAAVTPSSRVPRVVKGIGVLKGAQVDIEEGWIERTKGLIAADIFSDFVEMAEHLLIEGYKDPAAVLLGSVLEKHLRELCEAHEIPITREKDGINLSIKADSLNAELAKHEVYSKLDQKNVTAWLDLRNKAAHGHYDDYTDDQVSLLKQGIVEFMTRCRRDL